MDKTLENLYNFATQNNIEIIRYKLKECRGLYVELNKNYIFINNNITSPLMEKCIIAEEIGHFKAGVYPNNIYSPFC